MSVPKKHHFVPRWYLKRFTDSSGFLHIYDQKKDVFRKHKPENLMVIGNYYRQAWAPPGIDPDILEKRLGELIEPNAQRAFDKLLKRGGDLTNDDTAAICVYLEFQRIRVPRQARLGMQTFMKTLVTHSQPEFIEKLARGEVKIKPDSIRFTFMRSLIGQAVQWLSSMLWLVLESPNCTSFITTDSPVSFYNVDFPPPSETGIGLAGTRVFFPLSPKYLLVLRHQEYDESDKFSASQRLPVPEINDGLISITFFPSCSFEQVTWYNWLLLQLSDHIIAANDRQVLIDCVEHSLKLNGRK